MSPGANVVDSRQYRFPFAIEAFAQVPAGFVLPPDFSAFDAGVFLPRGDVDWLGRRRYPARILLLSDHEALLVPHSATGEQPLRVPLDRIERVEWGRILLTGWIVLNWDDGQISLPYNTRARGPVEKCVKTLMDRWLPAAQARAALVTSDSGKPLDLKFEYALSAELLAGEVPLVQFFQPSPAGDLLLVTSRRLLWITERHKGTYGRYGTVSHSARLPSIAEVRGGLEIAFCSSEPWRIPLREDQVRNARQFAAAVGQTLVCAGPPGPAACG